MSDTRPSENQDALQLPEMRRRGFFDDVPTGDDFFTAGSPDPKPVDHKAEAVNLLGAEWRNGAVAVAQVAEAQVHATLYLAEQQRLANIIAWTTSDGHRPTVAVQAQLEKGLGL